MSTVDHGEMREFARSLSDDLGPMFGRDVVRLIDENERWLTWSGGRYPDDSPGTVIHALSDGTIVLDDGVTTWNPLRALAFIQRRREENAERAHRRRE